MLKVTILLKDDVRRIETIILQGLLELILQNSEIDVPIHPTINLASKANSLPSHTAVLEPVKTLVLRYNTSVVNCVVKLRLVSVSNFYCNAGPNSCNNYSS